MNDGGVTRRALAGLAVLPLAAATARAQGPVGQTGSDRFVIAADRVFETRNLPALLAERLGYFRDTGLRVTLVDMREDVPTEEQLADGRIDAGMAFYHHTLLAQAAGSETRSVVTLGISPAASLLIASRLAGQVRRVSDLKGLKVMTGGANSGKTTAMSWLALRAGLKPTDYERLPTRSREDALKALAGGEADAMIAHEPDAGFLIAQGAAVPLVHLTTQDDVRRELGGVFPTTSLYLNPTTLSARAGEVRAVVGALLRAQAFIKAHDAAAIGDHLPKQVLGKDPKAYLATLAADKGMFDGDGRMTLAAAEAVRTAMAVVTPAYATIDLGKTFTNDFLPTP